MLYVRETKTAALSYVGGSETHLRNNNNITDGK